MTRGACTDKDRVVTDKTSRDCMGRDRQDSNDAQGQRTAMAPGLLPESILHGGAKATCCELSLDWCCERGDD